MKPCKTLEKWVTNVAIPLLHVENFGTENQGFARGKSNSVGGWGRQGEEAKPPQRFLTPAFLPYCPPASPPASQQVVVSDYTPLPCPTTSLEWGWLAGELAKMQCNPGHLFLKKISQHLEDDL